MSDEILAPDKKTRKGVMFLAVVAVVLATSVLYYLTSIKDELHAPGADFNQICQKVFLLYRYTVLFGVLLLLGMSTYLVHLGRKILRSERFPPPGARVIRETRVRVGEDARRWGKRMIVLSVIMLVLGLIFAAYAIRMEQMFSCARL